MQLTIIQAVILADSIFILGGLIGATIVRYQLKDWISRKNALIKEKYTDISHELTCVTNPTDDQIRNWERDIIVCETKINILLILYKEFIKRENAH